MSALPFDFVCCSVNCGRTSGPFGRSAISQKLPCDVQASRCQLTTFRRSKHTNLCLEPLKDFLGHKGSRFGQPIGKFL